MNRRDFFKALAAGALIAATPLKYLAPPVYRRLEQSLTFSDLVAETFRRHRAELIANIEPQNALLKRLME